MSKHSLNLWVFDASIIFLSGYLLFRYLPPPDPNYWALILFFAASVLLVNLLKSYFPGEELFSFENIIIMVYVLTRGFDGVWVAAIGILAYTVLTKQPLHDLIFLVGSAVLAVWGAATVFILTGGRFGSLDLSLNLLPFLGFLGSYLILVLAAAVIHRYRFTRQPFQPLVFVKDEGFTTGLIIMIGVSATFVYQQSSLLGTIVILILMLVYGIRMVLNIYFKAEQKYVKTIETFLNVAENKIPYYGGHSQRVTKLCRLLLNHFRLSREERRIIEHAALLHDIGKLGLPEKLLRIHSYLTSDEVQQLETHPATGKNLLEQVSGLEKAAELVHCHHEKYDGSGYPRSLAGEGIPFGARVIAVANTFDNLVFRTGLRFEQVCAELQNLAGSELDPGLVKIFLKSLFENKHAAALHANSNLVDRLEHGMADIVDQLKYYLDKSWVLGAMQMTYVVLYEDREIRNLGQNVVPNSIKNYLLGYIQKGLDITVCHKEFIVDTQSARILDAYFFPISEGACLVTIFDMTEVLKKEREREERELQIYRDVILAVTQGKLLLTIEDEIQEYLDQDSVHSEMRLLNAEDVAAARALVRSMLEPLPLPGRRKSQMVLCVSEAATNVIKHVGEGTVGIYLLDQAVRVVIRDNGPGIDISQLPQVTLRKGYSTKLSLGYGFSIMLDFLDRLIMSTKNGTILVLEMTYSPEKGSGEAADGKEVLQEHAC